MYMNSSACRAGVIANSKDFDGRLRHAALLRRRRRRAAELDHRRRDAVGAAGQADEATTRAWPTSSPTCPRRKCRPTGTSSRATCRSPQAAYELGKSQGYYDKNPGSDVGDQADHAEPADRRTPRACASATTCRSATSSTRSSRRCCRAQKTPQSALDSGRRARQRADPRVPVGRTSDPTAGRPAHPGRPPFPGPADETHRSSATRACPGCCWRRSLLVTIVFFLWPAGQAVRQSFLQEDAFGLKTTFVGLQNYRRAAARPELPERDAGHAGVHRRGGAGVDPRRGLVLALAVDRVLKGGDRLYHAAGLALCGGAGGRRGSCGGSSSTRPSASFPMCWT